MHTKVGDKVTESLADGREYPGIVVSDEFVVQQEIISRRTGLPVMIDVSRADILSQRTTLDGVEYTAITEETIMFGRTPITTARFDNVVGLDVTPEGALITLDEAVKAHKARRAEFREAGNAPVRTLVSVEDLD